MMNKIFLKSLCKKIVACYIFICCCYVCNAAPVPGNKIRFANNESPTAQQVVVKFLKWYKANLSKANNFPFLKKDSAGNYIVDKTVAGSYLSFIKSSGCIAQQYIDYWKVYFDDKAIQLKGEPMQSDVPEGFDFDLVLITQEPELILNKIDRLKFKTVSLKGSTAVISMKCPGDDSIDYEFEMHKTKTGWQIGYISTSNYD